jgi:hypothetical protein
MVILGDTWEDGQGGEVAVLGFVGGGGHMEGFRV